MKHTRAVLVTALVGTLMIGGAGAAWAGNDPDYGDDDGGQHRTHHHHSNDSNDSDDSDDSDDRNSDRGHGPGRSGGGGHCSPTDLVPHTMRYGYTGNEQ